MKKAFSLLELVFVISILAIISYFVLSSSFKSLEKANMLKIKSEISLIQHAIQEQYTTQALLENIEKYIESLDEASINTESQNLFTGFEETVLLDPIIFSSTSSKKEVGKWIKMKKNKYRVYLSKNDYVDFTYDKEEGTFSCKVSNESCKQLN